MADPSISTAATQTLTVPEKTREQFPDLIPFIEQSPSMNLEERQYWVDVLPIMTKEQVENLRDILTSEKKQIEETNKTYQQGVEGEAEKVKNAFDEEAYKAKKRARVEAEKKEQEEEKNAEEALLKNIQTL